VKEQVLFCWSGGKDSCMALHELRCDARYEIAALLTTVTETYDRISMHGVRRELLERQAAALGLPIEIVWIPAACVNAEYEARMEAALMQWKARGVRRVAFGDIFLQDLREYRERNLARVEMEAIFPIWLRPTDKLVREFIGLGFRAVTVCVDPKKLDESFVGREFNEEFVTDLSAGVDPCGENGEFHSFVYDGPGFAQTVEITRGEVVQREGFWFCDLMPAATSQGEIKTVSSSISGERS
jgi:uncharacterized protein (TIGR00290 family)